MHVLMNDKRLGRVLVDLAMEFDLPVRLPVRLPARHRRGLNWRRRICEARRRATRRGIVVPDRFINAPVGSHAAITRALSALQPGVTEMLVHPAVDSPTLRQPSPTGKEESTTIRSSAPVSSEVSSTLQGGASSAIASSATSSVPGADLVRTVRDSERSATTGVALPRPRHDRTHESRSAIVFAPHADDETLGCGNTIIRKVATGADVDVVVAFDGVRAWNRSWNHDELGLDDYVELRRAECHEACRRLGLGPERVHFLGFGAASETSVPELAAQLRRFASRREVAEVFSPCGIDEQEDHRRACGCGTRALR